MEKITIKVYQSATQFGLAYSSVYVNIFSCLLLVTQGARASYLIGQSRTNVVWCKYISFDQTN